MRLLLGLVLAVLVLGTTACAKQGSTQNTPSPAASASPDAAVSTSGTLAPDASEAPVEFHVAIEFALPGLAAAYREAGFEYAKPAIEYGVWGNTEPEPGRYDWGPLDYLVNEYQTAGYRGLQLLISSESPWAATSTTLFTPNHFPKEEFLDDYTAWVRAFVERYDGDGVEDAPGLLYGVHEWGVEREFTGFWAGSAEEYVRLLRLAAPVIREADPQARILLVALLTIDAFDDGPNITEGTQRLRANVGYRKSLDDIRTILAACESYEIVDFHSLADYVEIPATADWIRSELASNGCGDKPIVAGDAFPMSVLIAYNQQPFHPVTDETKDAALSVLKHAANPEDTDHDGAIAWLRAQTALGAVRKVVVSVGAGLAGINIGNQEDWKTGIGSIDSLAVNGLGGAPFFGLMDTRKTGRAPGGELTYEGLDFSKAREPQGARPAFHALALTLGKIAGFTSVQRLAPGDGVWAYRFETPNGPVYAAWYDDGKVHLPGDGGPSLEVNLAIEGAQATVTRIPTTGSEPEVTTLEAPGGTLRLTLDATPVFVEPD